MKQLVNRRSPAFIKATEFVKIEDNDIFEFDLNCGVKAAEKFVHRMRVEVSRMRKVLIQHGHTPRHFKMKIVSIQRVQGSDKLMSHVKLKKAIDGATELQPEIQEIFGDIAVTKGSKNG